MKQEATRFLIIQNNSQIFFYHVTLSLRYCAVYVTLLPGPNTLETLSGPCLRREVGLNKVECDAGTFWPTCSVQCLLSDVTNAKANNYLYYQSAFIVL